MLFGRTDYIYIIKSGIGIFKCRGEFDNLVFYASWSECHMSVVIDMEVYDYLFSERWRDMVLLGLCNYWLTRAAAKLIKRY